MENIITISMTAVICGCETWVEIEDFGKSKAYLFSKFIDLSNGTPSHDTFNRFFSALDPAEFEDCFRNWVSTIAEHREDIVSIDGKTIRGSRGIGQSPLHVVSAWSNANQLSLGQLKTFDKSNEITVIPDLLDALFLEDAIVTIDAMGCQDDIAEMIVSKGANYMLAVKGNQKGLLQGIEDSFRFLPVVDEDIKDDFGHGRIERRICRVISDLSHIPDRERWKRLKSIVRVDCERVIKQTGEVQHSTRYYISSLPADAKRMQYAIRSHWEIEIKLHWILDVAFSEDAGRKRNRNAVQNFSLLNKIALMMINKDDTVKMAVKSKRKKAAYDDEYLMRIIGVDHPQ